MKILYKSEIVVLGTIVAVALVVVATAYLERDRRDREEPAAVTAPPGPTSQVGIPMHDESVIQQLPMVPSTGYDCEVGLAGSVKVGIEDGKPDHVFIWARLKNCEPE